MEASFPTSFYGRMIPGNRNSPGDRTLSAPAKDHDVRSSYNLTCKLEDRYDRAQAGFKGIASGWTLSAIGAIGFLLLENPDARLAGEALSQPLLIFLVCLGAITGLYMLWFQDQAIYQKFLHCAFIYGLYLEYKNPGLPKIKTLILERSENNFLKFSLFYALPVGLFAFFALIAGLDIIISTINNGAKPLVNLETVAVTVTSVIYIAVAILLKRCFHDDLYGDYASLLDDEFAKKIQDSKDRKKRLGSSPGAGISEPAT